MKKTSAEKNRILNTTIKDDTMIDNNEFNRMIDNFHTTTLRNKAKNDIINYQKKRIVTINIK